MLTFTSKGPPVNGATVMLRGLGEGLSLVDNGAAVGEPVEEEGSLKMLLLMPDSVCTPPSLGWAGPGSSLLVSLGYILTLDRVSLNCF